MVDAAFYHQTFDQTYFLAGRRYARVKFTPAAPTMNSPGAQQSSPKHGRTPDEGYYFSGSRFARIKIVPNSRGDTVTAGPWVIAYKLKVPAEFDLIDAAIPVPGRAGEAYLFRGTSYVRLHIDSGKLTYGPAKISKEWPALTQAGFDCVDVALPVPGKTNGETCFFYRGSYARVAVTAGAADKLIPGPRKISDYWQTLDST
ncbi:Hemopexin [Aspergillus aurantiobrunneus]